ncbi:hypothetical protein HYQ46_008035 [Verticillium longisporum]|nr:hypothetical protein HYQ46_008035 [Verticillium longisporum]
MESAPTPQPSADAQHYPKHFPNMLQSYLPSHHDAFRRVLWTGLHSQLTTITVPEGGNMVEDIQSADQTITITTGSALAQHYPKHFPNMLKSYQPSHHEAFRQVLWTGLHSQLTTITVPEGGNMVEDIQSADQTITITTGSALAQVGSRNSPRQQALRAGDMLTVPAGAPCELVNTGPMPLGSLHSCRPTR